MKLRKDILSAIPFFRELTRYALFNVLYLEVANMLGIAYHTFKVRILGCNYSILFPNSLTELIASTTSLNPIAKALKEGVRNPNAAIGMAMTL